MKKTIFVLSIVLTMLFSSFAFAEGETVFSGNLRLKYDNPKGGDDSFTIHCMELRAAKTVGAFGVFVNERIGGANYNDLYEGWISFKAPEPIGSFKLGRVPVPFGIYANGLYAPKGILWNNGWMWQNVYGLRYDNTLKASETLGVNIAASFFKNGFLANERNTITGRVGADLSGPAAVKVGGSVQIGTLKGIPVEGSTAEPEDNTKLGIGGDVTISPSMLPVPVSVLGEFVNYSKGDDDTLKGNIMMGQLDVTPVQNMSCLDKAIVSLHYSMDSPTEGDSITEMIAQLRLIMAKQFSIFAQVFRSKTGEADPKDGLRIWFMYVF